MKEEKNCYSLSGLQSCIIKKKSLQFEIKTYFVPLWLINATIAPLHSERVPFVSTLSHKEKLPSILFRQANLYKSSHFPEGRSNSADTVLPQVD